MRRIAVVAAAATLLTTACNNTSPIPAPRSVVPANPVRSAADLRCSLPIELGGKFGFVDFPSGRFRVDASAPAPDGYFSFFYAHGAQRWFRADYGFAEYQLSPDETQLAAFEPVPGSAGSAGFRSGIALVDLRTNRSRHLANLPVPARRILGFLPYGIYVYGISIYRVDPATGKVSEIKPNPPDAIASGLYFWVTPSAAWSSLIAGPNQGDKNSVESISLTDGSFTTWYTAPATRSVSILGFVAPDRPLVAEYNTEPFDRMTGVSFMLLTKPGTAEPLNFDPSITTWGITDSFGVWLTSPGHLWLYDQAGLVPMANVPVDLTGTDTPGVAGFCR